jgi:hypothetical protein
MTYEISGDDITLNDMFDVLLDMGFTEARPHLIVADVLEGIAAGMRLAAGTGTIFTNTADSQQERLKNAIIKAIEHLPESEFANLRDLPFP